MTPSIVQAQTVQHQHNQSPTSNVQEPPKWKLFLLTFPAAYILSTLIVIPLLALLPAWPFIAINLIVNILLAFLLTYVALPLLTHLFRAWLYNQHKQDIMMHEEISQNERFSKGKRTQCAERSQL